jgi:KipI family sensor histidine kinase inhibitor
VADDIHLQLAGDGALIAYPAGDDDSDIAGRIQALCQALPELLGEALVDLVPSYRSLLLVYDPLRCDHYHAADSVRRAVRDAPQQLANDGREVEIPVYYGTESGEDIARIADAAGLSISEVIELHSATSYRVYAIGFAPGFAYLGYVDPRIAAPRLSTPRQRVPRGAVAIADRQTAVYPATSPGGWNIIGRSPTRMFDPEATPSMPVAVGDRVRFRPISREEFFASGGEL